MQFLLRKGIGSEGRGLKQRHAFPTWAPSSHSNVILHCLWFIVNVCSSFKEPVVSTVRRTWPEGKHRVD